MPVRQWVLSLPYRLRYLRAVFRVLRARARDGGVENGRGGAVAVVQRFGGAINLNIHVHALELDGVFARDGAGVVAWHAPASAQGGRGARAGPLSRAVEGL